MTMFVQPRLAPQPARTPESETFWDAARNGVLLLGHCQACGETHYYPRSLCPFCFGDDIEPREASGKGRVYSFSVMRRVEVPYIIAYVTLDEGPTMMTNIVNCEADAVAIDQAVKLLFCPTEGGEALAIFTPA